VQLIIDNRQGVENQDTVIPEATEAIALNWLERLDGRRHTLLCLERDQMDTLMVGGGPVHFVVTRNNQTLANITKSDVVNSSATIEVCAGGQYGDFATAVVVDLSTAQFAVKSFIRSQDEALPWV
jgi:hypothetical protein